MSDKAEAFHANSHSPDRLEQQPSVEQPVPTPEAQSAGELAPETLGLDVTEQGEDAGTQGEDASTKAAWAEQVEDSQEEVGQQADAVACADLADAKVQGPAPKPPEQPLIFDRIFEPAPAPASSEKPSFEISPRDSVVVVEAESESPSLNDIAAADVADASPEELLAYHHELLSWIHELEAALQDCQADFKSHLEQFSHQEVQLEQRTQELVRANEQTSQLRQDIEAHQKVQQRQTILVETLRNQLDSSQERVAQMERDFSQVQRRCSEQAQQLLQAENLCSDLKSRLNRQQRHTMQFKSALEKSLAVDISDSGYDLPEVETDSMDCSGELSPRPHPVKPWSFALDQTALNQALSCLDEPAQPAPAPQAASSQAVNGVSQPSEAEHPNANCVEPVFDPKQAESLTASLKQDSQSILVGSLPEASHVVEDETELELESLSFVPPIQPALKNQKLLTQLVSSAAEIASDASTAPSTTKSNRRKVSSLAAIDLPTFPRP